MRRFVRVAGSAEPWLPGTDLALRMEEFRGADEYGWSVFELDGDQPPEHYVAGYFANRRGRGPAIAGYVAFTAEDLVGEGTGIVKRAAEFELPEDIRLAHRDVRGLVASGRALHLLDLVDRGACLLVEVDRIDLIRRQVEFLVVEGDGWKQAKEIRMRGRQLAKADPEGFQSLAAMTSADIRSWIPTTPG